MRWAGLALGAWCHGVRGAVGPCGGGAASMEVDACGGVRGVWMRLLGVEGASKRPA